MEPQVTISEEGRSGTVRYSDATLQLSFYWEFGGGDAVAIVQVSDAARWRTLSSEDRARVLRVVAAEVVRQRAPSCRADIDEAKGVIVLREGGAPQEQRRQQQKQQDRREAAAWMGRYRKVRSKFALIVLVVGMVVAGLFYLKNKVLVVQPGKGTPLGLAVRTDRHIAVLLQTLEPYTPSLHRDPGKDRYAVRLFLVPLDGTEPKLIPVAGGLSANTFGLARILGSDGHTLWFELNGLHGVDLTTYEPLTEERLSAVDEGMFPRAWASGALPPRIEEFLAAGFFTGPNTWLGLHAQQEVDGHFKPKSWLKRVVQADEGKVVRGFYRGTLDPDTSDDHHRIQSMTAIGEATYLKAAFIRMDFDSEPVRVQDPPGALFIHASDAGLRSTVMVARCDTSGTVLWHTDTGIDHFLLQQILPGADRTVFVGTRPAVPDRVSEPLLVLVDHRSGTARTISLWQ